MEIHLPNSAHLSNFESFWRSCDFSDGKRLVVTLHPKWVSVHPMALALTAAAAQTVRASGGSVSVTVPNPRTASVHYLVRMGLFSSLGVPPPREITEHESAGRFIPITQIRNAQDLHGFITDMIPLLHDSPDEVGPVKYIISELVRNVLEHSESPGGAFVCAQYYRDSRKVGLGVVDSGIGIRGSLSIHHPTPDDYSAIALAMRPGITGTSTRFGGTEYNAGAGLFYTKSIAVLSKTHLVISSGQGYFKLLKTPSHKIVTIQENPALDFHREYKVMPDWHGTGIGIDVGVPPSVHFSTAFERISKAFRITIKERKKMQYKRPRFVK